MKLRGHNAETAPVRRRPPMDAVLALALAVSTATGDAGSGAMIGGESVRYADWSPPLWVGIPFGLLVGVAAWWRRRRPVVLLVAALAAFVTVSAYLAVVFAQYTVAERTSSWLRTVVATFATCLVVGVPIWRFGGFDAAVPLATVLCVAPALLGMYVRTRREVIAGMRERAERAEREQNQFVLRARSDERAQIARDMHDVVTHRVSLMVLHATALEAARGRDATTIAQQIGAIGREALGELRSLVEVLRADGDSTAPTAPQPGLADLAELVAASRRLGMPVTGEMTDESGHRLPALIEHAVYRVVQEALTNVHKHAGAAATRVRIQRTPRLLRVTVANGPGRPGGGPELPSARHGLLGIAERIRLVGGELTARPTRHGGFEIIAEVPLTAGGEG